MAEQIVLEHLDRAAAYVGDERKLAFKRFAQVMYVHSRRVNAVVESPLEMLFLIWWNAVLDANGGRYDELGIEAQSDVTVGGQSYRVDFRVLPYDERGEYVPRWQPIAVEVDGHAFHERTKEQVKARDSRDRALASAGWRVFHFSFSEFTSNPTGCVLEVMEFADQQRRTILANHRAEAAAQNKDAAPVEDYATK